MQDVTDGFVACQRRGKKIEDDEREWKNAVENVERDSSRQEKAVILIDVTPESDSVILDRTPDLTAL